MSQPANPVFLYVADTSFFIEIHKRYPKRTLPGIWKDLETLVRDGRFIAPENVKAEINRQDDELKEWVSRHSTMFEPLGTELWNATGVVVNAFPRTAHALSLNPEHADPFVIGLAMKLEKQGSLERRTIVVVAEERGKLAENPRLRDDEIEKIPDVCEKLRMRCETHLDMFKREGFRFY